MSHLAHSHRWRRLLTHPSSALLVLGVFALLMLGGVREKSLTFDELAHVAGGYASLHLHDFRLQPENGILPQYVAGLALSGFEKPDSLSNAWNEADVWTVGFEWLFGNRHNALEMIWRARAASSIFALALAFVVWSWSRQLFGAAGALLSLLLLALCPTILANGPLVTSDVAAALFFMTSLKLIWQVLDEITLMRVLLCGLSLGALVLSKMSSLIIVPVAAVLVGLKMVSQPAIWVRLGGRREYRSWWARSLAVLIASGAVTAIVVACVWAGYGFRFSAFASSAGEAGRFALPWEYVLAKPVPPVVFARVGLTSDQKAKAERIFFEHQVTDPVWTHDSVAAAQRIRDQVLTGEQRAQFDREMSRPVTLATWCLDALRVHRLLPEAWIYGNAFVLRLSEARSAFLNGEVRDTGWWWFFPYAFATKTPIAFFVVGGIALAAAILPANGGVKPGSRRLAALSTLVPTAPLCVFVLVYASLAMSSRLNIGHRHLLPVYPALCVLCGVAMRWWEIEPSRPKTSGARVGLIAAAPWVLAVSLIVLVVEVAGRFPNYLAYFNGIITPGRAYRHLVDSSLDWGQDLPAVQRYIDAHRADGPFYLSYFGTSDPSAYGVTARPLHSFMGLHLRDSPDFAVLHTPKAATDTMLNQWLSRRSDMELVQSGPDGNEVVTALIRKPEALRWEAGTYLVSATMLQMVHGNAPDSPRGRWNAQYERTYQALLSEVGPLMQEDRDKRLEALMRRPIETWAPLLNRFQEFRFARLAAFLRGREPDENIASTVLAYRLTAADVLRVQQGEPPEQDRERN